MHLKKHIKKHIKKHVKFKRLRLESFKDQLIINHLLLLVIKFLKINSAV